MVRLLEDDEHELPASERPNRSYEQSLARGREVQAMNRRRIAWVQEQYPQRCAAPITLPHVSILERKP